MDQPMNVFESLQGSNFLKQTDFSEIFFKQQSHVWSCSDHFEFSDHSPALKHYDY